MTLSIPLPPALEAKLRQRTTALGKDVTAFVLEAVEEKLRAPESLAELLAPIHNATRTSDLTEDELDTLIETSRDEVVTAKRAGS